MRTDSICLKSWRISGGGPWSKQQAGRMTLAAAFCTYRAGKTAFVEAGEKDLAVIGKRDNQT